MEGRRVKAGCPCKGGIEKSVAILQMEKIHLCAMKRDRKKVLELLQRRGTVELKDLEVQDEVFRKDNTTVTQNLFSKNAQTAEKALEVLKKYAAEEKGGGLAFLKGRTAITPTVSDAFYSLKEDVLRVSQRVLQLERDMAEANAELLRIEAQEEALKAWLNLPVPQTFSGTRKTAVFIGSLDGEHSLDMIYANLAEVSPGLENVYVEIVSDTKEQTSFFVMVLKKDAQKAEEALRAIGFARPVSPSHHMPQQKLNRLEEKRGEAEDTIKKAKEELASYGDRRDDIRFLQDHMNIRTEKYSMIDKLAQTKHVFVLEGYVPKVASEPLKKELEDSFQCSAQIAPLAEDEEAPVLLRNSVFSEPTESVLESYSLPGKGELDPVGVMSIFYYIMFGLMFSDAGYGLILAAACGICLLMFKNMDYNWKKNLRLFFWCGVSTLFWGIIFSSYFGNIFDQVAITFFGYDPAFIAQNPIVPPVWFAPLGRPMLLLMFCLAIGIVHLTTGYIMKGITCVKNNDIPGMIYDSVFPILLLYPLVIIFMGTDMFLNMAEFKLDLPPIVGTICFVISGICMVGILLTGGRESKNWGKRLLKGMYALYNSLAGWLSDILSYSRLLALGLATGVIGSVVNQLGGMSGSGVVGLILFIVIFVVGHSMNFGINILGAYVHSNRLEYVEFFGKFYEGGGRKFAPFGIHTKYYKIEEETQNV